MPGAATQPLPSWIWWHACPGHLHDRARARVASTAARSASSAGRPGIGRRRRAARAPTGTAPRRWRGPTPRTAPAASAPTRWIAATIARVARHARRPALRGRERRDDHPDQHQHAERADRRARDPVPAAAAGSAIGNDAVHEQRRRRARTPARSTRRGTRNSSATPMRSSACVPPSAVTTFGHEVDADREPGERRPPTRTRVRRARAASRRTPATRRSRDDRDVERVHSPPGVGGGSSARRRATVRKPGVRDHAVVGADRLALDVPAALQHLERLDHPNGADASSSRSRPTWRIVGRYASRMPPGHERLGRVLHDPPRLGQVEHDAVEVALVDAFVDVAHLDVERDVGAEEAVHVLHAHAARSRRGSRSR